MNSVSPSVAFSGPGIATAVACVIAGTLSTVLMRQPVFLAVGIVAGLYFLLSIKVASSGKK